MTGKAAVRVTEQLLRSALHLPAGAVIIGAAWRPACAGLDLYLAGDSLPPYREGDEIRFVQLEGIDGTDRSAT